tara:strand:+ start:183 stop:533 length:351 start_codon:yes stop_codon:yes gene_type:complete
MLSLALVAGAWASQGRVVVVGCLVGALLATVNFRVLATLVGRITETATGNPSLAVAGLMGKLLGMAVAVFLTLKLLRPNPVAVVVGLSVAPLSLLMVGLFMSSASSTDAEQPEVLS